LPRAGGHIRIAPWTPVAGRPTWCTTTNNALTQGNKTFLAQ
jgi:hypothetical protein